MTNEERKIVVHKALVYAAGSCARAEQCEYDIRLKLQRRQLTTEEIDRIVQYLAEKKFLSDERYARAYVRTRCGQSGVGPLKIRQTLAAKRIPSGIINTAMTEADASVFEDNALKVARRKSVGMNLGSSRERARLFRFLISRGFESGTIQRVMSALNPDCETEDVGTLQSWED